MTHFPAISVLMPVFNREQYIAESIKSILNQDFADFELIIVDDGSSDRTLEIIHSLQEQRIRLFSLDKNFGIAYARNYAFEQARGEYFAIMDSDDIASPKRLSMQYQFLQQHQDIQLLGTQVIKGLGNNKVKLDHPTHDSVIKARLLKLNASSMIHPSTMMRASFLKQHQLSYPAVETDEDHGLWIHALQLGAKFANLPDYLLYYRRHNTNITSENNPRSAAHEARKTPWRIKLIQLFFPNLSAQQTADIAALLEKNKPLQLTDVQRAIQAIDEAVLDTQSYYGESKAELITMLTSFKERAIAAVKHSIQSSQSSNQS